VRKPIGILHFRQLLRLLEGDEPEAEPPRILGTHTVAPHIQVMETVEWLRWRGYRVVATAVPGTVINGFVFGRKNEPAYIVAVGDTLIWDGEKVVIK
jgi:hypothetical protein